MKNNASVNMAALDASANQNGSLIRGQQVFAASVQVVVTGTSTGTLVLQASNDAAYSVDAKGNPVPVNWISIPSATVAITGAGAYLIPKLDVSYQWLRTSYAKTNGAAGTITATVNVSGV